MAAEAATASRITSLPPAVYYIPNFISEEEEAHILSEITRLPASRWTVLSHRRLLSLPSQLTGPQKDTLIVSLLPKFLDHNGLLSSRLADFLFFEEAPHRTPNHCLVNEYQPGQGIMPHTDGPAYFPTTATVSLGAHTVLDIYDGDSKKWRVLQEPRSLLVTTDDCYRDTRHGIAETAVDEDLGPDQIVNWGLLGDVTPYEAGTKARDVRVSLTYRDVRKVAKLGGVAMRFGNKS